MSCACLPFSDDAALSKRREWLLFLSYQHPPLSRLSPNSRSPATASPAPRLHARAIASSCSSPPLLSASASIHDKK